MAIPASCAYCGTRIHLQPSATGKKVRCPSCSGVNVIGELRDGAYLLQGAEGGEDPTVLQARSAAEGEAAVESGARPERPAAPVAAARRAASGTRSTPSEAGTTPFVLGLLGLILCQCLAPVAWIMGNGYRDRCRARNEKPDGLGEAGRIMGMIGTVLIIVFIGIYVLVAILAVGSASMSPR